MARSLYYDLLLGPRGYGRPIPAADWERQYERGAWDLLDSVDQIAHYMVIVGYLQGMRQAAAPLPSLLDVGCGAGRLLQLLAPFGLSSYLGIDLSAQAIGRAESLGIANARFEVADFEAWEIPRRFGAIVFNESLYYAKRPVDVLSRYSGALEDGGVFVVSLWRHGNHGIIWNRVGERFDVVHSCTVVNDKRQTWDIRVLRPQVQTA